MCFSLGYSFAAPPSSSAMSPVGYSSAVLSSSRLRFADLFNGGAVFGCGQQEKTSQPLADLAGGRLLPSSKPAILRVFYSGTDTSIASELEEQSETVAIGCHSLRARIALTNQPVQEELLDEFGKLSFRGVGCLH